jgi:hypothetical protein
MLEVLDTVYGGRSIEEDGDGHGRSLLLKALQQDRQVDRVAHLEDVFVLKQFDSYKEFSAIQILFNLSANTVEAA